MTAEVMNDDMRATAKMLGYMAQEAEPAMIKTLLFPSASEIRLLYVDSTARPTLEEETIAPFYFSPSTHNGIHYPSAISLIRPEEEGKLRLPVGWGTWDEAETLWEAEPPTPISRSAVQYVSDADGKEVSVIVPIELWQEIMSARETAYLVNSESLKQRLPAGSNNEVGGAE